MADRYQNYYSNQSGMHRKRRDWRDDEYSRGSGNRSRDEDEGRYSSRDDEREFGYGPYTGSDEGDSSVRAGSYDQGRTQYGQSRDTGGQSGSTGRYAGYGDFGQGDYSGSGYRGSGDYAGRRSGASGQGNYGQTGYGQGGYGQTGYGQGGYGQSGYGRGDWNEPYGEGQQYTPRGEYAGSMSDYGYAGRGMGQHRGKGPKGYQRSDERIKEMICERLQEDPDIDPSEVTVNVSAGKITLEGTVDSRHTKNAIEDIADQFGVQEVQNNLRVQRQGRTTSGMSSGTTGTGKGATGNDDSTSKTKQH